MKIAFLTIHPSSDKLAWSGLNDHIHKALEIAGAEVINISGFSAKPDLRLKLDYKFNHLLGKNIPYEFTKTYAKQYGHFAENRLKEHIGFDAIITNKPSIVAYLKTSLPVFIYTDGTFRNLHNYYGHTSNMPNRYIAEADEVEKRGFEACKKAMFSSGWAANSAMQHYKVPSDKTVVIQFGSNMDGIALSEWQTVFEEKMNKPLRLLLPAVEFNRKGGDIAVEALKILLAKGIDAKLVLVGMDIPETIQHIPELDHIPFISKETMEGRQQMEGLFRDSHFLILPTKMDCSPVVLSEAAVYGLPALASNLAGIPSVVEDGSTGFLFPVDAGPEEYASRIIEIWTDKERYRTMAVNAFQRGSELLNWKVAGGSILKIISTALNPLLNAKHIETGY